jgi:multidrug efflux pump subunit AcrA (membrane-fusion protein)
VFVVSNGIAERRSVRTGTADGDRMEIVSGLAQNERVVVSPPPTLISGAPVTSK